MANNQLIALAADVRAKRMKWLWKKVIPRGRLTILEGDPGISKSLLTVDLAARVSTGAVMPDGTRGVKGCVLLLSAEDSFEETTRTRLEAAGADLRYVAEMTVNITIPKDLPSLSQAITQLEARTKIGVKLVVLDPLLVYLGVISTQDQAIRQALMPLVELAGQHDTAILAVRHLTKSLGRSALVHGGGSGGIMAQARSALLVANDPKDGNMRVLCHIKANQAAKTRSLLFEPVTVGESVCIKWHGACDYTAEDLLGKSREGGKVMEAEALLLKALAKGPGKHEDLKDLATKATISLRTLERAKASLGVTSERHGRGPGSHVTWQLPKSTGKKQAKNGEPRQQKLAVFSGKRKNGKKKKGKSKATRKTRGKSAKPRKKAG